MIEGTKSTSPNFTQQNALLVLETYWNISGTLKPLDSFLDQNFLVKTENGNKYVLKIANIETHDEELDLQNKALIFLESNEIPKVIQTLSGEEMLFYKSHWWRVLSFLDGKMLSVIPYHSDELLYNIGKFSANLSNKLVSFSHPSAKRFIQWDLQYATTLLKNWVHFIKDENIKSEILAIVENIENKSEELNNLRKSIIHADLTRYNLLINEEGTDVNGVIDFGDICYSWSIGELVVLLLESIITESTTPFLDAYKVLKSFHTIFPIYENEVRLLYPLMQLRSAIIVSASARQMSLDPENEYVKKQYLVDKKVFSSLQSSQNLFATTMFMAACGFQMFNKIKLDDFSFILNEKTQLPLIDISPISDIYDDGAFLNDKILKNNIDNYLDNGVGFTEYLTPCLQTVEPTGSELETILLGNYVFLSKNTEVFSPFDMIFLRIENGKSIFKTSYFFFYIRGIYHTLQENQDISKGDTLGFVEQSNGNLNFPNHIFMQIDKSGNAPEKCKPSGVLAWKIICENPAFLLPNYAINETISNNKETLFHKRESLIQQSQEYYYKNPINLVRGWKQYLYDENGQVYLDAINNVAHVGHSHPKISSSACKQFKKLNTNARFLYKENIEYAEKILKYFPPSLQTIFFTCTGSEANDLALRLARCYTNENDIIVIDGEYHGNTTAVDEISTCLMDNPTASKSKRSFTHPLIQPNIFRGKYRENEENVAELYAQDVEEKINEIHSENRGVAAFISESLLGSGGGVEMPKTYLKKVYEKVKNAGGVCIADEVQIGFGRMGTHFWGFEKEDVLPDIVTIGKPMGNGYPIAAVVTTKEIAQAYKEKYTYFNTYSGNAVACQIASTVLDIIEEEKLQKKAFSVGGFLKQELEKLIPEFECIGAVYGFSMYLGVDIVLDKKSRKPDSKKALLICEAMKKMGIIIYPTGDYYNILKIKPPLCFTKENAVFLVDKLREILIQLEN